MLLDICYNYVDNIQNERVKKYIQTVTHTHMSIA